MNNSAKWQSRILYSILLGKKGRDGIILEPRRFQESVVDLMEHLASRLGGSTQLAFAETEGRTIQWGPEPSSVIWALTDNEANGDEVIEEREKWLIDSFVQDEIWIYKQPVHLFIAMARLSN